MSESSRRFRNMLLASALLGVLVGGGCALFTVTWHAIDHALWETLDHKSHRIWISTLAGFVIGLVLKLLYDPGSMAVIIYHFHKFGRLPMKDNGPILPVSMIGLVAGQSAGPEGALTQAGGSLGSWLAPVIRVPHLKRLLTLAGMGAGFGAFLGAPVGGAMLWLEMLHTRGLEYYEAVIPTIVCSCTAYLVMVLTIGHGVVQPWHVTVSEQVVWWMPFAAVGIGAMCGPVAKLYALIFRTVGRLFQASKAPLILRTTLAGLIIGLLGYFVPLSYFYGSYQIPQVLALQTTMLALAGLLVAKMIAASVTVRGHWQGGLIIPHMLMGAVLGKMITPLVPGIDPLLIILCCMAAFNAAATQTPLASALIVLALTGCGHPVPIFLASFAGFLAGQGVMLIENKQSRTEPHNFHLEPVNSQIVA